MRFPIVLVLGCLLMACNRPAAEAPAADAAPPAAATPEAAAVDTANCRFCADPPTVRTCDIAAGVRTTLHWKIVDPKVTRVGIFVVDDAGADLPFAEQLPVGSIQSGPWLKPGLTFKLKDSDGNLLESLEIAGKGC